MSEENSEAPSIQVFRPTYEEFKDFNKYIAFIESQGAHKAGIAKIIPPPEWKPRKEGYDLSKLDVEILQPIQQIVTGKQGLYEQSIEEELPYTVEAYKKLAESERYRTPSHSNYEELERKYWRNLNYIPPIYGADISGSLMDEDLKEWNLRELGSILDLAADDYDGVNSPYLYFGMWKTTVTWHIQDMDLYCINYLHFGDATSWYVIPPAYGRSLEKLANISFPKAYHYCPGFLRHKMTLISPKVLTDHSIPYNKVVQEAGEIIITFPYAYASSFNHGFNCSESVNFASERWVEYGKRASTCICNDNIIKIPMDEFVKRFQPEKYEAWIRGEDVGPHPEDKDVPTVKIATPSRIQQKQSSASSSSSSTTEDKPKTRGKSQPGAVRRDSCDSEESLEDYWMSDAKSDESSEVRSPASKNKRRPAKKRRIIRMPLNYEEEEEITVENEIKIDKAKPTKEMKMEDEDSDSSCKVISWTNPNRLRSRSCSKEDDNNNNHGISRGKKIKIERVIEEDSDIEIVSETFSPQKEVTIDHSKILPIESEKAKTENVALEPLVKEELIIEDSNSEKDDQSQASNSAIGKHAVMGNVRTQIHNFLVPYKEENRQEIEQKSSAEKEPSSNEPSCNSEVMVERVRIVDDIQTGEVVWAKLQDKKFAQAKVISTSKVTFYKALLSNNVYCPNFYPSEVLNFPVDVQPPMGAKLKIRWTDNKIYDATFQGSNQFFLYNVLFGNSSKETVSLRRQDIFKVKEELPQVKITRVLFTPKNEPLDDEQPTMDDAVELLMPRTVILPGRECLRESAPSGDLTNFSEVEKRASLNNTNNAGQNEAKKSEIDSKPCSEFNTAPTQSNPLDAVKAECESNFGKEMAVNEGDIVWAKHTDSRYHKAQVKCVQNRISYVFSDDGNPISEPTEINHSHSQFLPQKDTNVKITLEDGKMFDGIFNGVKRYQVYKVAFDDGSETTLLRSEVFKLNEEMPKNITTNNEDLLTEQAVNNNVRLLDPAQEMPNVSTNQDSHSSSCEGDSQQEVEKAPNVTRQKRRRGRPPGVKSTKKVEEPRAAKPVSSKVSKKTSSTPNVDSTSILAPTRSSPRLRNRQISEQSPPSIINNLISNGVPSPDLQALYDNIGSGLLNDKIGKIKSNGNNANSPTFVLLSPQIYNISMTPQDISPDVSSSKRRRTSERLSSNSSSGSSASCVSDVKVQKIQDLDLNSIVSKYLQSQKSQTQQQSPVSCPSTVKLNSKTTLASANNQPIDPSVLKTLLQNAFLHSGMSNAKSSPTQ